MKETDKLDNSNRICAKYVGSVYLLFSKDGELLLLKRRNTGYEDENYGLVSGHMDGNETVTNAAIREAFEESGVKLKPDDLGLVHVMHRKATNDERIDFFFQVRRWEPEPANKEPEKCEELAWFPQDKLPKNTIPYIRQAISCIQSRQVYSESGWTKTTGGN